MTRIILASNDVLTPFDLRAQISGSTWNFPLITVDTIWQWSRITLHMTWNGFTLCIFQFQNLDFVTGNLIFIPPTIASVAVWSVLEPLWTILQWDMLLNPVTVYQGIQEQFTLQLAYSCRNEYEIFGHKISVLELEIYKM